jgi:hypothetical protein
LQWDERALTLDLPSTGLGETKAMESLRHTMLEAFKEHHMDLRYKKRLCHQAADALAYELLVAGSTTWTRNSIHVGWWM